MRTINSSYYGLKNKVADLQLAITLLGFEHIRNLALTTYISQLFEDSVGHGSYRREALWNHLIGVGTVAKQIANLCGGVPAREAYLAGLLHDLGLILIDQYLNKPFCQVIDALSEDTPLCAVEMEILGFTHAQLGAFVAEKWDMPDNLVATIRHHHEPARYQGPHRRIVCVVALGNLFCSLRGLTSLGVRNVEEPSAEIFTFLGLGRNHIASIWESLDETLQHADIMALAQSATRGQGLPGAGRSRPRQR
jgi:putative nucleotidyltransferase with HDIG domain